MSEESESVDVRDDRVKGVRRTATRGVGIRVLVAGAWGFAATADDSADAAAQAAALAVDVARASRPVPGEPVRLDDTPPATGTYLTPHQRDPLEVPLAEKVDHLL